MWTSFTLAIMIEKFIGKENEIQKFSSAEDALQFIECNEKIDLIFTDVMMNGMTGDQLALKIKEDRKDIPVVGVTGMQANEELERIFDWVVTKPLTNSILESILEKFLGIS